jgi:transposase
MNKTDNMTIKVQKERAGGIDIHTKKAVVCSYIAGKKEEVKDYGTFTEDLEQIRDDLLSHNIRDVIIESTGIYWIALCSVLTLGGIHVTVVNPKFIKNMPKEKTDKKDAKWLCKLLVNGMVRNSFVASEEQRSFRDLCRQRSKYTNHITQAGNRIIKNLERRNIKLKSVASNTKSKSVKAIIAALAQGETDVDKLVLLCKGKLKKKEPEMRKALHGVLTTHDRLMIQDLLNDIAHYEKQVETINERIKEHTDKVSEELIKNLRVVAGVGAVATEVLLAEVGSNVEPFPSEDHLAAWVGLAPGNAETGGKAKPIRTRDGNKYLRTVMIQVAWAAVRTKNSYWRSLYYHLSKRINKGKAIIAVARKLIRIIYKIIKGTKTYTEYGGDYFVQHLQERYAKRRTLQA